MTIVGEQILQFPARTNQSGHAKGVSMTHVGKSLLMTDSMETKIDDKIDESKLNI